MKRAGLALLMGVIYGLVAWGVYTVIGGPEFSHHHLTDSLVALGIAAAFGHWCGYGDGRKATES